MDESGKKTLMDGEFLESFRALQTPTRPTFVKDFLSKALEPMPGYLEKIATAIEANDCRTVAQSAHAIKSTCLNLGVKSLADVCLKLELLGKSQTVEGAKELHREAVHLCEQLRQEIFALPEFKK